MDPRRPDRDDPVLAVVALVMVLLLIAALIIGITDDGYTSNF